MSDNSQGRLQVRRGFTILELVVVLAISAAFLGFAGWTFSGYVHRTSAQRAAQLFARDLALARASAIRGQEPVVIRFNEASRWYRVSTLGSGAEIVRRRFGVGGDLRLTTIDLVVPGDSIVFSARGVAEGLTGSGSLGEARFTSNQIRYSVHFNRMGASRVRES